MDPKEVDLEESPSFSTYNLRTRAVTKRSKKELKTQTVQKSPKLSKKNRSGKHTQATAGGSTRVDVPSPDDFEESQESVSMLHECYQKNSANNFPELMETCMNAGLEVIDIYSDEETEVPVANELTATKVESSTQTDCLVSQPELNNLKETEMVKHAKFISSVIRLKAVLSSNNTISEKKLSVILQGAAAEESPYDMEVDETQQTLPKETIGYLLRSSDVENVFRETVQFLLQYLEDDIGEDFTKIACFWKNSVYEIVVEILSQAVDSEAVVWKIVASFLYRIVDSILNDKSKNWMLESKTNLIISFCQSTRLSYSVINYTVEKLKKLNTIQRPSDAADKLTSVILSNNAYFLLQILECSLELLKSKVSEEAIEGVLVKKPQGKNYNVLEMWKKHWNRNEHLEEQKTRHEWQSTVSWWCDVLDEILLHCMNHIPVLSIAVERCVELAKEILKLCHSGVMEGKV